jgi:hypothetical protein
MDKEGSVHILMFNSNIVMEGMSKTTKDLRMSGKPGHVEYDSVTGNGWTASWMSTWADRQTDKTVGKVTRNPLEQCFSNFVGPRPGKFFFYIRRGPGPNK